MLGDQYLTAWDWQVIGTVGDMVGVKYFPAEPNKQQVEVGQVKKVDWRNMIVTVSQPI